MTEPVNLILHIGTGKTGTTSIQSFLYANRRRLAELGYLYPRSPGLRRHSLLSLSVLDEKAVDRAPVWHRLDVAAPVLDFRETVRTELFAEIERAGLPGVLLSDEALFGARYPAVRRLQALVGQFTRSVRLVVYLRRQDDHVASRYQQVVKTGETRRLEERVKALDLSGFYDYYTRLAKWQSIMEPSSFEIRRFERDSFVEGSLLQDFLDAAGIEVRADELEQVAPLNESLDAESVELLRILNKFRVERGAKPAKIDNRSLIAQLQAATADAPGPTLTLSPKGLAEFMARWEDSNRRVAEEFLHEDGGVLFRSPRKTSNTTSDQIFDPARLDHFLPVLDLPEDQHAALRELVEQEASST